MNNRIMRIDVPCGHMAALAAFQSVFPSCAGVGMDDLADPVRASAMIDPSCGSTSCLRLPPAGFARTLERRTGSRSTSGLRGRAMQPRSFSGRWRRPISQTSPRSWSGRERTGISSGSRARRPITSRGLCRWQRRHAACIASAPHAPENRECGA